MRHRGNTARIRRLGVLGGEVHGVPHVYRCDNQCKYSPLCTMRNAATTVHVLYYHFILFHFI